MNDRTLTWSCTGPDPDWCRRVEGLLPDAIRALDLEPDLRLVAVFADDSPREEGCWLRVLPPGAGQDSRRALELHCSARSLGRNRPLENASLTGGQVWDAREGAWSGEAFDPADLAPERASAFLHHNLLLARDLVREEVSPAAIPIGQVQAFDAAWKVVVDGRLARAGLPGYSLAHRRGRFSRLFSSAGVLMPDHWQIFQSLWDGGLATGRDVLAIIRQLPRL